MCLDLFIYVFYHQLFYHQLFFFIFIIYIIAITCKKILKGPLSSFNIYYKKLNIF